MIDDLPTLESPPLVTPPPPLRVADVPPAAGAAEWVFMVGLGVAAPSAIALTLPLPYLDDGFAVALWFAAPFVAPPALLLGASRAWGVVAAARGAAAARRALGRDGRVTFVGTLRARGDATAPVAWVERDGGRSSASRDFELACDDGTRLVAEGGAWAVFDPLGPHVTHGRAELHDGDRVIVDALLAHAAVPSERGDYRGVATQARALAAGGSIAPEGFRYARPPAAHDTRRRALVASVAVSLCLAAALLLVGTLRDRPVATGGRCDRWHPCAEGSWCKPVDLGRGSVCASECTRDAECPPGSACHTRMGYCFVQRAPVDPAGDGRQFDDCTSARCAAGHRCIGNVWHPAPREGRAPLPENYCVRTCRADAQCDRGLWCVAVTPDRDGWCERVEHLPEVLQMMERMHRDAGLDEPDVRGPSLAPTPAPTRAPGAAVQDPASVNREPGGW